MVDYGPLYPVAHVPAAKYEASMDDHEFGGVAITKLDGWSWLALWTRTTWSSWLKCDPAHPETCGNRLRNVAAVIPRLTSTPWEPTVRDVFGPWDQKCAERNTCGSNGSSPIGAVFMPSIVHDIDGQILLFGVDDVGWMTQFPQHHVGMNLVFHPDLRDAGVWFPISMIRGWIVGFDLKDKSFPIGISDVALGDDGLIYALVSGNEDQRCWWLFCNRIDEWVSTDHGLNFRRGTMSWFASRGDCAFDAGYIKDGLGHIKRSEVSIVANISKQCKYADTDRAWGAHYWISPKKKMPATWGHFPLNEEPHPIRRRLRSP